MFGCARLTFNNVGSTRILGGVIVDVSDQSTFGSLEVEHRLRDDLLLTLDARAFLDIPSNNVYSYLNTESFVEIALEKFFQRDFAALSANPRQASGMIDAKQAVVGIPASRLRIRCSAYSGTRPKILGLQKDCAGNSARQPYKS